MLIARKIGAVAEALLPRKTVTFLRRLYGPLHDGMVSRIDRRLLGQVFDHETLQVAGGPFKGMRYVRFSSGSALMPKLVGSYEMELAPAIERLIAKAPPLVINIGCAEGYYAVGFAQRVPAAKIVAFDLSSKARERCRQMCDLNQVTDRVSIRGECTIGELQSLVLPRSLLVVDCEGAELILLNPKGVTGLSAADMIVELHDFIDPTISSTLVSRFKSTHKVQIISGIPRDCSEFPILSRLAPEDQKLALEEFRPERMQWAVFEAINKAPTPN